LLKVVKERYMKIKLIKWLGTVIVIVASFYFALKLTDSRRVVENKIYKFNIPETVYKLNDDKKVEFIISLYFNTKDLAKKYKKNEGKLINKINQIFSKVGSEKFISSEGIIYLKAKIFMDLNVNGIPVEKIDFKTKPLIY
jgi:hypothetical protein